MTGWAQVNCARGQTDAPEKIQRGRLRSAVRQTLEPEAGHLDPDPHRGGCDAGEECVLRMGPRAGGSRNVGGRASPMKPRKIAADPRNSFLSAVFRIREFVLNFRIWCLRKFLGMDIGKNTKISLRADLDFTNPRGVHIGDGTLIAFHAVVFSHDLSRHFHTHTFIGRDCFIGAHAIIMPGVSVGDQCIVGAGSVVTQDVPSGCIVAGNPARILRSGIRTRQWGILIEAYEEALARAKAAEAEAPANVAASNRISGGRE